MCVSAVSVGCSNAGAAANSDGPKGSDAANRFTSVPRMAELSSRNAMTELGPETASGCFTISMRFFSGTRSPSTHSSPLNTQWRECSELAWAIWNSSTSVGSRCKRPKMPAMSSRSLESQLQP